MIADLAPLVQFDVGSPMHQCRAVPFKGDGVRGLILAHCDFPDIDAHARHLRYPTDTLRVSAFSIEGRKLDARKAKADHADMDVGTRKRVLDPGGKCPADAMRDKALGQVPALLFGRGTRYRRRR